MVADHLADDVVRGVALTDGLIGTFADVHAADGLAGRCFLYHLVGNGTGRWRVPVGGMGAVSGAMAAAARRAGAELVTRATVTALDPRADGVTVHWTDDDGRTRPPRPGTSSAAPPRRVLAELTGADPGPRPSGSQLKVNMVLARLPRLRSGADPATAFAGTFHVDEAAAQIDAAYAQAAAGQLPDVIPFEVYCHSLTDPSILGPVERATGHHTLTLFGLHTPAELFRERPGRDAARGGAPGGRPARRAPRGAAARLPGPRRARASRACRPPHRWTSRRRWPCRAGTSSTATWPGRSPRDGRAGRHLGRGDRAPADRRGVLRRHGARRRGQRARRLRGRPPPAGSALTRAPRTGQRGRRPGRRPPGRGPGAGVRRRLEGRDLALIAAGLTFYAGHRRRPAAGAGVRADRPADLAGAGERARRPPGRAAARRSSAPRTR